MGKSSIPQDKSSLPYFAKWFTGKTVMVTGATSGIGREIARLLACYGSRLLLCGRDKGAMDMLVSELGSDSVKEYFLVDFSNNESLQEAISNINKKHEIDILINNAGFGCINDFCNMPQELIHTLNSVNMLAVIEFCRAFVPKMQKRQGTGVLNVGSTASFFATPGSALYGATKHFILGFTDALHQEMLSKGVHVTGIYPGNTESRFLERSTGGKLKGWEKAMSPRIVAEMALEGLSKNKIRIIPGYGNKVKILASRVLPVSILLNKVYTNTLNYFKE